MEQQPDMVGRVAAPPHYAKPREVVDQLRDGRDDETFAVFCDDTAYIYEARAGGKGDPVGDAEKAAWWRQMAVHARGMGDDPRADRPGFTPYRRIQFGSRVLCVLSDEITVPGVVEDVGSSPHHLRVRVLWPGCTKVEELHRADVVPAAP